ncbi:MAG: TolB family protein, partial [Gaiellales bacterium]
VALSPAPATPAESRATAAPAGHRQRSRASRPAPTSADSPASPTSAGLLLAFDSDRTGNYEIYLAGSGGAPDQLTRDRAFDSFWPKISPDGRRILFYRTPARTHDLDYGAAGLWIVNTDGAGLRRLLAAGAHGWEVQAHAEWSPDGRELTMLAGPKTNPQIYVTTADGTSPRRVTSDGKGGPRPGLNLDPSWHPNGRSLLFVGCDIALCLPYQQEIYSISVDGSGVGRLTSDGEPDYDPYYSPDGSRIAWLRNTGRPLVRYGIFTMRADGSGKAALIDDGGINSKPEWAPDSSTVYFHRQAGLLGPSPRFNLYSMPGTGRTPNPLLEDHGGRFANEYPDVAPAPAPVG